MSSTAPDGLPPSIPDRMRRDMTKARFAKWSRCMDHANALPMVIIGVCTSGENKGTPIVAAHSMDTEQIATLLRRLLAEIEANRTVKHTEVPGAGFVVDDGKGVNKN